MQFVKATCFNDPIIVCYANQCKRYFFIRLQNPIKYTNLNGTTREVGKIKKQLNKTF